MFFKKHLLPVFVFLLTLSLPYYSAAAEDFSIVKPSALVFHAPAAERPGQRNSEPRKQYSPVRVGKQTYYYRDGLFFRLHLGRYITIDPPVGARVGALPRTAVHLDIGPSRYFRVGLNWYLFHGDNSYEVVEDPRVAENPRASENIAARDESEYEQQKVDLAIYPADGQSDEQLDRDRYECHLWASQQSGFDPTLANQELDQRDFYVRAMTACLEGRAYSVQ